jgi:hypothetical protein
MHFVIEISTSQSRYVHSIPPASESRPFRMRCCPEITGHKPTRLGLVVNGHSTLVVHAISRHLIWPDRSFSTLFSHCFISPHVAQRCVYAASRTVTGSATHFSSVGREEAPSVAFSPSARIVLVDQERPERAALLQYATVSSRGRATD